LASDLVVLPSVAEALPTVLIEAAAAGRPVVATRVGGVPEVVDHGRSGLLVPPDDSQALLSAITQILTDPERASYLGERARQIAVERFGLERMVDQTLDLWAEVLDRGGR
jgi:glycosyltransferase involved in cell wall biosynthesis